MASFGLPANFTEHGGEGEARRECKRDIKYSKHDNSDNFTFHSINTVGEGNTRRSNEIESEIQITYVPPNKHDFTLAAFGLPEPPGLEPPSTPLYVLLLIAAGVGLVLAIGFRFLARRRAARS